MFKESLLNYSNTGRLNDAQGNQAVGMVMGGMSYREVDRRLSCANSTIMRLVERHNVTGSVMAGCVLDVKE